MKKSKQRRIEHQLKERREQAVNGYNAAKAKGLTAIARYWQGKIEEVDKLQNK